jgi:hypothetical protein
MFSEARAQSRRDVRLVARGFDMYRNKVPDGHTGFPNSRRRFPFAEPEHVKDCTNYTRILQCESLRRFDQTRENPLYPVDVSRLTPGTYLAMSSFGQDYNCIPGYIKSVAPLLRTLTMHIIPQGNLGTGIGTKYSGLRLIHESMTLPEVALERVELILTEPLVLNAWTSTVATDVCTSRMEIHHLPAMMIAYVMLQRELEAAAVAFLGLTEDEGISMRDWLTKIPTILHQHENRWHIEASKNRRACMERRVEHTGLRSWRYHCRVCSYKFLMRTHDHHQCIHHDAHFNLVFPVTNHDPVFFCKEIGHTVWKVDGEFRDVPPTQIEGRTS